MATTITRFYNKGFNVKRQVYVGNKSSLSVVGSFSGHIQQARPEDADFLGLSFMDTFFVWCDESVDVEVGDTIEDISSGVSYSVEQVQLNDASGDNKHKELVVQLNKS